jgi:hypothetical protein
MTCARRRLKTNLQRAEKLSPGTGLIGIPTWIGFTECNVHLICNIPNAESNLSPNSLQDEFVPGAGVQKSVWDAKIMNTVRMKKPG